MVLSKPRSTSESGATTYTSITVTFILFIIVVVLHALRYTRLYNCSYVHKLFVKLSHKLNGQGEAENDTIPEEPDRHKPERTIQAIVTHSVVELQECLLK